MDIDIIIPVYNSRKTLRKTLESIANQNIHNFSVCLVNDGSTEEYSDIITHFQSFFPIKEITLLKNVGPGLARNYGLKNTNGKYIIFIDSDDAFYDFCSVQRLYDTAVNGNFDVVISNFVCESEDMSIKKKNTVWLHGKIYKRCFLEKYDICFSNSRAYEDSGFNQQIFLMNPNIFYLDEVTYIYCDNSNSLTRKNNGDFILYGLEGLSYNICYAVEKSLARNCNEVDASFLMIGVLISMYFYYLDLGDNYDVSSILKWSRPIKELYNNRLMSLKKEEIDLLIEQKKEKCIQENKFINEKISFYEFLNMIE